MKFSVCIPAYNNPSFLARALESVKSQNYSLKEVVVFDDCSSIDLSVVINEFRINTSIPLTYVRSEVNLRPPVSWNRCVSIATGDIFVLLPHDDELAPGALAYVASVFQSKQDVGMVTGMVTRVSTESYLKDQIIFDKNLNLTLRSKEAIAHFLGASNCHPAANFILMKNLKPGNIWQTDYWDDWVFYYIQAYYHGVFISDKSLAIVHAHSANLSTLLSRETSRPDADYRLDQLFGLLNQLPVRDHETRLMIYTELRNLGDSYMKWSIKNFLVGNFNTAYSCFKCGRLLNPMVFIRVQFYISIIQKLFRLFQRGIR